MRWWDGHEWTDDSDMLRSRRRSRTSKPLPGTWIAQATKPRPSAPDIAMSVLGILLTSAAGAMALGLAGLTLL